MELNLVSTLQIVAKLSHEPPSKNILPDRISHIDSLDTIRSTAMYVHSEHCTVTSFFLSYHHWDYLEKIISVGILFVWTVTMWRAYIRRRNAKTNRSDIQYLIAHWLQIVERERRGQCSERSIWNGPRGGPILFQKDDAFQWCRFNQIHIVGRPLVFVGWIRPIHPWLFVGIVHGRLRSFSRNHQLQWPLRKIL